MKLWEILVLTLREDTPVRTRSHKEWDRRVRAISGDVLFPFGKGIYQALRGVSND
jgi:hypothetical protein